MLNDERVVQNVLPYIDPCYKEELSAFLLQIFEDKIEIRNILLWMVTTIKWTADQTKGNLEEGSQGGYSEKLTKAINLLEELKK